jgi:hypothetical protein
MYQLAIRTSCLAVAGILANVGVACAQTSNGAPQPAPSDARSGNVIAADICRAVCPKAFVSKLSAEEAAQFQACMTTMASCLPTVKPGGFIAGRDTDPMSMVGKQMPDILFNRPDFLKRGLAPGLVDG